MTDVGLFDIKRRPTTIQTTELGITGILYVEFDPKVHSPTTFVAPWQEPRTDTTTLAQPGEVKEGTIFICPSYTLHYVKPNQVRKHRTIISFDLLPKLPDHQSV